jgi:HK97 family phage prohead protease
MNEQQLTVGVECLRDLPTEVRRSSDDKKTVFIINTKALDAHGTIIEPEGGDLSRYMANPVVLINHDLDRVAGKSSISLRDGRLVAEMEDADWDLEDPEIRKWHNKVRKGFVKGASIRFKIMDLKSEVQNEKEVYRIPKWELMEWSIVSIPSNPETLNTERALQGRMDELQEKVNQLTQMLEQRQPVPVQLPVVVANVTADPALSSVSTSGQVTVALVEQRAEEPAPEAPEASPVEVINEKPEEPPVLDLREVIKIVRTQVRRELGKE